MCIEKTVSNQRSPRALLSKNWALLLCFVAISANASTHASPKTQASAKNCAQAGYSAWAAEWTSSEDLDASLPSLAGMRSLWMRQLAFDAAASRFKLVSHPVFDKIKKAIKANSCVGALIHNANQSGFDPELGKKIISLPDAALVDLAKLARAQGWRLLQVDVEALPEDSSKGFEDFLKRFASVMKKNGIRASVALHAKEGEAQGNEQARFQRWKELAKIDVDFAVMAYDHHWATSEPGPVAPWEWVQSVARYAASTLPKERVFIGLPNYGYLWKQDPKTHAWQGEALLASELERKIRGKPDWRTVATDAIDGESFTGPGGERIAFDGPPAIEAKSTKLRALGFHRFAIWRVGGILPRN